MASGRRVSLDKLLSASVPLTADQAAALVGQLCRREPMASVEPSDVAFGPEHVWLDRAGTVHLSPGVEPSVRDLGALLQQWLREVRRDGPARMPPGLVLLTARATGQIDAAPFVSTRALGTALARFEPSDPHGALRALVAEVEAAHSGTVGTPADEEVQALADASTDAVSNYEYQEVAATTRALQPEPVIRPSTGRSRLRPAAAAALAAAGFAAGAAVAIQSSRSDAARATNMTEVIIAPRADAGRPVDPSPRGAGRSKSSESPKPPAGGGRTPQKPFSPPMSAPIRETAPEPAAVARPAPGGMSAPQPLVDASLVEADGMYSPSFASGGAAVFFHAQTANGSALKRAERGDGGVLHVVTIVDDGAKNYHVQLAPDGKSVAFDSDRDGVRGVYLARADGSGVRRLSGVGYAAVPTWSPDGRRLAFLRAENERPNVWNLWVIELSSGEMTRLTNHRYGQVWGGAWFPDGRRIAYSHEDRLILLELGSGQSASYASPRKGRLVRTPAVSPDGRRIMFQVSRDGAWLLDLAAGSMERVLDDTSAEEFTWAPDGRRVAFHSRRSGEWGLWMMAAR
jgi:hypothetical protein